ncbi:MAG TPA: ATP-binding cassette domain-containing protein [Hyphomicrobiaceae bacterium]|nr:ATP-binding cassette domain-containing protein [Hyphomicrobiaceae bacterium]
MRDRSNPLPIEFQDVAYAAGNTPILNAISLAISAGPPTLLLGPNGSGKTTLLKLAMGLLTPVAGRILYASDAEVARRRCAFVFQKPVMLRRSAARNIAFALKAAARAPEAATIERLLQAVGLGGVAERPARRLSGGEQQRLALARALARDPAVLFLDEPTASLDPAATKSVEDIIVRTAARGVKIVMATHDLGQARRLAGNVVLLANGGIVEQGAATTFFQAPATAMAKQFLAGELIL